MAPPDTPHAAADQPNARSPNRQRPTTSTGEPDFLARANYCGQTGDSGSPVYAFHHTYGIHQGGGDPCAKLFQSIVNAQDGMNVDIILAP
jgi:hypothetical protein